MRVVEDAMAVAKPDVVIHLAAQAGVRYSLENPQSYLTSNVTGSYHIIELRSATRSST